MGSSSKSSRSSYSVVVDDHTHRSTSTSSSTSSSNNMSSGASYPSSGSSNPVVRQARAANAGGYTVGTSHRPKVSVYNHNSVGYDRDAPHPGYSSKSGSNASKRGDSSHSHSSR
ncbi:hypothetical protein M426DRAFT_324054 [Hypoxylon sp. CI-4A]|nr:hypothetical protein M426DRAFT_324054 [Hypoxylon sp. CI-4A]